MVREIAITGLEGALDVNDDGELFYTNPGCRPKC